MHSEDEEALREAKRKRNEHWFRMRRARAEWSESSDLAWNIDDPEFWLWLENFYGLKAHKDSQGNITDGYTVVNEKLYTLFLLKFGQ